MAKLRVSKALVKKKSVESYKVKGKDESSTDRFRIDLNGARRFVIPIHLLSPNFKEHWMKKAQRNERNGGTVKLYLRPHISDVLMPVKITLTRLAPRPLD